MKKGILFDLDGTLWDSSKEVAESWCEAAEKCPDIEKVITEEDVQKVMGKTMEEIADIIFDEIEEKEERMRILQFFCDLENDYLREHGGKLFDNLEETLKDLKKDYHVAIVSNCQKGYIEAFLDYYNLHECIDDYECYGNTLLPKGESIKLVLNRNNLEKAVYVGDTQGDYEAAKHAGLPFIHAKMGYGEVNADVANITRIQDVRKVAESLLM